MKSSKDVNNFTVAQAERIAKGLDEDYEIVTKSGLPVEIYEFNSKQTDSFRIVAIIKGGTEDKIRRYNDIGYSIGENNEEDLVIRKKANTHQFKPYEYVIGRCQTTPESKWTCGLFSHMDKNAFDKPIYMCVGEISYTECLPYEGNEHLIGTTDKP